MNIWFISKYARPLEYGFGTRQFYLSSEFKKKGNETLVICSDSNHNGHFPKFQHIYNLEIHHGVTTCIIRTKKYKRSFGIKRIISWIDFEVKLFFLNKKKLIKPDVIIVSSLSLFTILNGYYLKRKFNAKLIFEVRDIWPLTPVKIGGISKKNIFIRTLKNIEKFGYIHSDLIVGTMPNLKDHIHEVLGFEKNVVCIPQGFDSEFLEEQLPLDQSFLEKYYPKNKFIIGYAGSVGASNALETLIECAFKMSKYSNIHFLIIGNGDKRDFYIHKTQGLKNITFAPKIRRQQVQNALKLCDVLYDSVKNNSLYNYGLSRNKWIDYMLASKPMLVSYKGYKSMINEAKNGFFIDPEDSESLKNKILELSIYPKTEIKR
ncbi:MAG: hypothetical protein RIR51_377, partial [Bacteroidota bacterium]